MNRTLYAAEVLSIGAALMHLWVMPEHFEEWWGYGVFFLVAALAQGAYCVGLPHGIRQPLFLFLGVIGNLSIVSLWIVTRTVGVPLGPHAGDVEEAGIVDLAATAAELGLVFVLVTLLLGRLSLRRGQGARNKQALL